MKVVLDTNVILQARATSHKYHSILKAWNDGLFTLALSNEILAEYEEVIIQLSGVQRWKLFARLLDLSDRVLLVSPTYRFAVISSDPDDNKFVDCAITAEADYLVTEDGHFKELLGSGYKPQPILPSEFIKTVLPQLGFSSDLS